MSTASEPQPTSEFARRIDITTSLGRQYAKALFTLDSRLAVVNPDDVAAGFEVGEGADLVAFKVLGFKHAVVNNNTSAGYSYAFPRIAEAEEKVLTEILKNHSPPKTRFSYLNLPDWLKIPSFSPHLTTILRMAPSWFNNESDPAAYLKEIVKIHQKLKPNSAVVLSALNDHPLSADAFRAAEEVLSSEGVEHQLFLNDTVPPELQILGQRILVIKK